MIVSDGTLNPNGIRFGSAEIYSIVDQFNGEVADSLCVAQRNPVSGDERVVLFLKVIRMKSDDCAFLFQHLMLDQLNVRQERERDVEEEEEEIPMVFH